MPEESLRVRMLRSDDAYTQRAAAPPKRRADIYRCEPMAPFKAKRDCYHVPLRAAKPGGYDVVMASEMLGILPPERVGESWSEAVALLADNTFWETCRASVEQSLARFAARGIQLPARDCLVSILLGNPESPALAASKGYCGDGGIPRFVLAWLVPNDETMRRMPAALAHETNHNGRFRFVEWSNDVTLGEMMVSEGLGENFAVGPHGEDTAGPWMTKTSAVALEEQIKPIIRTALDAQGMAGLSAYLYGDAIAAAQGHAPVGLPYCAGYACGCELVKCYLDASGADIADATPLPASTILKGAKEAGFWA